MVCILSDICVHCTFSSSGESAFIGRRDVHTFSTPQIDGSI